MPGAVVGGQNAARGPQGRQNGADPELYEDARGLGHRSEVAGDGGVLQVARAPAGQLGELLPVGLDQVRRAVGKAGRQGRERRVRGVDGDAHAQRPEQADEADVPVDGGSRRQRPGEHGPAAPVGGGSQLFGQRGLDGGGLGLAQARTGFVELRRRSVRLGDGGVDSGRPRHGNGPAGHAL